MGCPLSARPGTILPCGDGLPQEEQSAYAERQKVAQAALKSFCQIHGINCEGKQMPTIGVALSGGGWGALISSCAFFDALSEAQLLHAVTYVAGLSGGSWCVYEYLLGGDGNPFHGTTKACDNPWLAVPGGAKYSATDTRFRYSGLQQMVNRKHVRQASKQDEGWIGRTAGILLEERDHKDLTVASALLRPELGESFVERWSNFLMADLLFWSNRKEALLLNDEEVTAHVKNGTKPIFICSAIANGADCKERKYDWIEFTPFGVRRYPPKVRPAPGTVLPPSDIMGNLHPDKVKAKALPEDMNASDKEALTRAGFMKLFAHNLMGICGSAFALDFCGVCEEVRSPFLKILAAPIAAYKADDPDPVLGGTTKVPGVGELRDAGLCFNVPYPALLADSGRDVDILIVMEASHGSKGAETLQLAMAQGYYEADPKDLGADWLNFGPSKRVHIFHPKDPRYGPVIVFFLGLTERDSADIIESGPEVIQDCATVRRNVHEQFMKTVVVALTEYFAKGKQLLPAAQRRCCLRWNQARYRPTTTVSVMRSRMSPVPVNFVSSRDFAMMWMAELLQDVHKSSSSNPLHLMRSFESKLLDNLASPGCMLVLERLDVAGLEVMLKDANPLGTFSLSKADATDRLLLTHQAVGQLLLVADAEHGSATVECAFSRCLAGCYHAAIALALPLVPADRHCVFGRDPSAATRHQDSTLYLDMSRDSRFVWTFFAWALQEAKVTGRDRMPSYFLDCFKIVFTNTARQLADNPDYFPPFSLLFVEDTQFCWKEECEPYPWKGTATAWKDAFEPFSWRELLRGRLGVDVAVELTTILLDRNVPTDFLFEHVNALPDRLKPIYPRLVLESAARFGHVPLLDRCLNMLTVEERPKCFMEAMAAAVGSRQEVVLKRLQGVVSPLTLPQACAMGQRRAVEELLALPEWDNCREAVEACFTCPYPDNGIVMSKVWKDEDNTPEFKTYIRDRCQKEKRFVELLV